jgi:SagB-type dehydrogenase family enzyme
MSPRAAIASASLAAMLGAVCPVRAAPQAAEQGRLTLPEPAVTGTMSIEEALNRRRSVREYSQQPITLKELSQLLWAAQGISGPRGMRTAPSAGALYPLRLYVVGSQVTSLSPGLYAYRPHVHALDQIVADNVFARLIDATFKQQWMRDASAVIVIAADYAVTASRYGARAERFVNIEVGHAAQNVYLQAAGLNVATVMVGAFDEAQVAKVLRLPQAERPIALMPVGKPK